MDDFGNEIRGAPTVNTYTKLVLDYPLQVWRLHQSDPYCVPVYQQKWKAHTEPDGATGYVWIDVE